MEMASSYNIVRNNYFHNEQWMTCSQPTGLCGNRDIGLSGNYTNVLWNVFDGNVIAHSGVAVRRRGRVRDGRVRCRACSRRALDRATCRSRAACPGRWPPPKWTVCVADGAGRSL